VISARFIDSQGRRGHPLVMHDPRRRILLVFALVVVIAVGAAGGYGLWYLFLRPAGPAAVSAGSLTPVADGGAASQPLASGGLAGTWGVDTSIGSLSDFSDSWVGYRVQETLASIGANIAVGRTPKVSGTLIITGTQVTAGTITADLTALQSDDSRRDGQLTHTGLETSSFPTATFSLTSPIDLGTDPTSGQEIDVMAQGTLALHGVTRTVSVPLRARLVGSVIEVTGTLPITFSDYGIQAPTSFIALSVSDTGTMELRLLLTHA
jgi:polyisoprenoid-binding protein YceI